MEGFTKLFVLILTVVSNVLSIDTIFLTSFINNFLKMFLKYFTIDCAHELHRLAVLIIFLV